MKFGDFVTLRDSNTLEGQSLGMIVKMEYEHHAYVHWLLNAEVVDWVINHTHPLIDTSKATGYATSDLRAVADLAHYFNQRPPRLGINHPHRIGDYRDTPMVLYVANDNRGEAQKALLYNPTHQHILTPDETQKVIDLLQIYIHSIEEQ